MQKQISHFFYIITLCAHAQIVFSMESKNVLEKLQKMVTVNNIDSVMHGIQNMDPRDLTAQNATAILQYFSGTVPTGKDSYYRLVSLLEKYGADPKKPAIKITNKNNEIVTTTPFFAWVHNLSQTNE